MKNEVFAFLNQTNSVSADLFVIMEPCRSKAACAVWDPHVWVHQNTVHNVLQVQQLWIQWSLPTGSSRDVGGWLQTSPTRTGASWSYRKSSAAVAALSLTDQHVDTRPNGKWNLISCGVMAEPAKRRDPTFSLFPVCWLLLSFCWSYEYRGQRDWSLLKLEG